jgi:hypothetical protein
MRALASGDVGVSELVWYVSYGPHLNRARFITYIEGGRIPGNNVVRIWVRIPNRGASLDAAAQPTFGAKW